jgi:hypothetical protein
MDGAKMQGVPFFFGSQVRTPFGAKTANVTKKASRGPAPSRLLLTKQI